MFNFIFFGLGALVGGSMAAIVTENGVPLVAFFFCALYQLFVIIAGAMLPDEVETNKFAAI